MSRLLNVACMVMVCCVFAARGLGQVAVIGKTIHTSGPMGTIVDGVILIEGGKIAAIGPASEVPVPDGSIKIRAAVVLPGLIDARSTVGLSGLNNTKHDSDQLETSQAMQPELRAIDAYNPQDELVGFVRSFGITTIHTGHAPGELISGQTMVVKTTGQPMPADVLVPLATIATNLGPSAFRSGKDAPGTRGKQAAMLRSELIKAKEYAQRRVGGAASQKEAQESAKEPAKDLPRDLRLEMLADALAGKVPLMITAHRSQDILTALRLREEFGFQMILDGASEAYLVVDQIKASGVPVSIHPAMMRAVGEAENASFTTAGKLADAGIVVMLQAGYEAYVPKTRIVLFEGAIAAVNGLNTPMQQTRAIDAMTILPAKVLGIDARVGSLEVGKDADIACFDGDPLEYTTHCTHTLINGMVVWQGKR